DGKFTIDFDDFAAKAADPDTAVCIFCNPHNPTGRLWTQEELRRVGTICMENGLTLISDEIHCDLIRSGKRHTPLASLFPNEKNIITCMAPSKTFNIPGLQFSNIIIANDELRQTWQKTHNGGENPLSVTAAHAAYAGGYDWLMALRTYLDENFAFTAEYFAKHAPKVRFRIAEATYLAWADFGAYFDETSDIALAFAERGGVLLESGATFVQNTHSFVRLNLACPRLLLEKALSRICDVLNNL
ncbi:MAG: aminotransferase class I/II-fold pyridoxal phosphate-dependent enzyme, partial [Oscillospiraceae bacterium]|nr:aminotransferase class I/II-fold pyridoxal phosphate-dependent enzyme [Oscillospiraceae bacterium]